MEKLALIIGVVILSGCASQPPAPISKIPAEHLTVAEVRTQPERFVGSEVRWGGMIAKVENKTSRTWIEVVSRELKKDGKPIVDSKSEGRFIASFPGFVDPVVYETGNLLTVVGTIEGRVTQPIGEYQYTYPIIAVTGSYMWKVEAEPRLPDYPPPWWYYDPWWPYYPRPYTFYPR